MIKIETWRVKSDSKSYDCYVVLNTENKKKSFIPVDDEEESLWTEVKDILAKKKYKKHYGSLRKMANMQLDAGFDYKPIGKLLKTTMVNQ